MLAGLIIGRPIDRAEFSLTGDAALKLCSYFFGGPLFERVGATARDQRTRNCDQHRKALHLLILESERGIARMTFDCGLRKDQSDRINGILRDLVWLVAALVAASVFQ